MSLKGSECVEKIFEEIMTEKFQKLMKTIHPQRSSKNPKAQNMKKITPRHVIIKLLRTDDTEKILKVRGIKRHI